MKVDCTAYPKRCTASVTRGAGCRVNLYVDGAPWSDPDLDKLPVNAFAGVEYYVGASVPALYYRNSECGVLLLWTRDR